MRGLAGPRKMSRMKHLNTYISVLICLVLAFFAADGAAAGSPKPPAVPAHIELEVDPVVVAPGSQATVSLQLSPVDGVKINRYPRVRLKVPQTDGLVGAVEGSVGNDTPISAAHGSDWCSELPQRAFDPDKAKFHFKKSGFSLP